MSDLPEIERLQAIAVQPGDLIVVKLPDDATQNSLSNVASVVRERFPDNEVLVVTASVDVAVMRPELVEAAG